MKITYPDGTIEYYKRRKLHNSTGPSIIRPNGTLAWFLNDNEVSPQDLPIEYNYLKLKYNL